MNSILPQCFENMILRLRRAIPKSTYTGVHREDGRSENISQCGEQIWVPVQARGILRSSRNGRIGRYGKRVLKRVTDEHRESVTPEIAATVSEQTSFGTFRRYRAPKMACGWPSWERITEFTLGTGCSRY